MKVPRLSTVTYCLTPGNAERIESHSDQTGNLARLGVAKGIKYTRNALCLTCAITIIAATRAVMSDAENTYSKVICYSIAGLGMATIGLTVKRLFYLAVILEG